MRSSFFAVCLLILLSACHQPDAEISFAEPLPVAGRELRRFSPRHQGLYVAAGNPRDLLRVTATAVIRQQPDTAWRLVATHVAPDSATAFTASSDSARMRRPVTPSLARGRVETTTPAGMAAAPAADSVALPLDRLHSDTLFQLGEAAHLRRHRTAYYLSQAYGDDGIWQVQRLRISGTRIWLETVESDTTRLRKLLPAAVLHVQRHNRPQWPLFLLRPTARTQRPAVLHNAALWRGTEFVRVAAE